MNIATITAREILDSRGNPTVEATVTLDQGSVGIATVPSGASTGSYEAVELRDARSDRYDGKGVLHAVKNIETSIAEALIGQDVRDQAGIDKIMMALDGTANKSKLGANAILAVSLAVARAAAAFEKIPLYAYLRKFFPEAGSEYILPIPLMNIMNGGAHAGWTTDIQEYMIMPQAESMAERVRMGEEIYQALKVVIEEAGYSETIGDEGGFAPAVTDNEEPFKLVMKAIASAGYTSGEDVTLAIDAAAAEWYRNGQYHLKKQGNMDSARLVEWYHDLIKKYPLVSLEDPFGEDDWSSFTSFTASLDSKIQVVGDDLYVTNVNRIEQGIQAKATTAVLIKPNQIGSLTETIAAIQLAHSNNLKTIISHRSGETMDDFIADLAVAANSGQIKAGAPARGERVAKYNRLMAIEEELNQK
jgi:enolase